MSTRSLKEVIEKDPEEKMVFLSAPRQGGKATVAKAFLQASFLEKKMAP
jgi:predicted AAA+ superfamily ATPase